MTKERVDYSLFAERGEDDRPTGLYTVRRYREGAGDWEIVETGLTLEQAEALE